MPPRKEPAPQADSDSTASNPIQNLAEVLQELLKAHQPQNPYPFRMDTQIQLPKYDGQSSGEAVDSLIRSLSTYFNTCPDITEVKKLQIVALQLEGITQVWWDTE